MQERIIAFVGMMGSGKGSCTDYLHDKYGWPVIHFGKMVYEEVQRRGLDNVKDENFVRRDMREKEGPAVLAKHAGRKAEQYIKAGEHVVVLDGLYSWSEYKYLEDLFRDKLVLVATVLPKAMRRERVLSRNDSHRTYTLDEVIARDISEIENVEKGGPIAYADYYIHNDGNIQDMNRQLEHIIDTLGAHKTAR